MLEIKLIKVSKWVHWSLHNITFVMLVYQNLWTDFVAMRDERRIKE